MTEQTLDVGKIYRELGHVVLRRAQQILGNDDEAEDAMHDIFSSLAKNPAQFHGRSKITTWLYSATTHHCFNRLRDKRNRARLLELHVAPNQTEGADASQDRIAVLRQLMSRVSPELAEVAFYYYADQMTQEEIAPLVPCTRRAVSTMLEQFHAEIEKHLKEGR